MMNPQRLTLHARSMHPSPVQIGTLMAMMLFAFSAQAQTDQILPPIGGLGGGQYTARCAGDQILTGFDLRTGDDVDAIRPLCVAVRGPTDVGPINPYPSQFGGNGGGPRRLACPSKDPLVVGLYVIAEGVKTVVVNNIHLFCGPAVANQTPAANPTAVFDGPKANDTDTAISIGNEVRYAGGGKYPQVCPSGLVAVGINGRSGKWLDAVGLTCGAPPSIAQSAPTNVTPGNLGKPPVSLGRKESTHASINQRVEDDAPIGAMTTTNVRQQRDPPICASARSARAKNSPAALGLEKQCAFARTHR